MLKERQSANGTRWAEASRRALLQASPRRGPLSLISVSVILEKPKATTHGHATRHPCPSQESDILLVSTCYPSWLKDRRTGAGSAMASVHVRAWAWSVGTHATS